MEYGLIAKKLGHSFSPAIHAKIGDYLYELHELPEDKLDAFLRAADFRGINVTIPYKSAVIPYLYEIDERAKAIGAVNTVVNRSGRLYGYNTDFDGMRALFAHAGVDPRGKKALILGSGGTSKTARAVLTALGATEIYFVRRDSREGAVSYAEAYEKHGDASVIVNTTPCGMFPNNFDLPSDVNGAPVDIDAFPHLEGLIDVVFNPLRTRLVLEARRRGIKAMGGLYMLVSQAVFAAGHFFDKTFPAQLTDEIYGQILREKTNLVLVGMPSSGKTTLGRALAARLSRDFYDLDAVLTDKTGRHPAQIITEDGEDAFRRLESAVVREISIKTGVVIATGGGCVTREENVEALRQNGAVCFVDRPLPLLIPTGDRPLSSDENKLKALALSRRPLYERAADFSVVNDGEASAAEDLILKRFIEKQVE